MAHIYADRVKDTFTTTGTGAVTVSGTAAASFRTFSAVCSTNDTFYYCIEDATNNAWETGLGTYSGTNQITRTTVRASSNAGSAVNLSAGTKTIFITPIAYMFQAPSSLTQLGGAGAITGSGLTMATARLIGRTTASTGAPEEITVGTGLSLSAGSLTSTVVAGRVLLVTLTASASATLADTTNLTSTYALYVFELENILPATDGAYLNARVSIDAGSSWISTANYNGTAIAYDAGVATNSQIDGTSLYLGGSVGIENTAAQGGICGTLYFVNPAGTTAYKRLSGILSEYYSSATPALFPIVFTGQYKGATTAINGIQFYFSSGNITSGKIRIYGIKTS